MRILILGGDGYLGWPTAMRFSGKGNDVAVVDDFSRRRWHEEAGTDSLTPIASLDERIDVWREVSGKTIEQYVGDIAEDTFIDDVVREFRPETIIHYGEQPSAPWSMKNVDNARRHPAAQRGRHAQAAVGDARAHARRPPGQAGHDGRVRHARTSTSKRATSRSSTTAARTRCRSRSCPGSFYHLSKVHDSHNIHFACRIWGIRATDLNQGVVYGIETPETKLDDRLATRFDYDEVFGTALNRFCVQAMIGHPLTVYGKGGQTRGLLNILDTLQCVELTVANPADPGEMRVYNQFTESVLGRRAGRARCRHAAGEVGVDVTVDTSRTRASSSRSTTTTRCTPSWRRWASSRRCCPRR